MRALERSGLKGPLALADAVFADKGHKGSGYFTPRKKPAGGEQTDAQKRYNAQISAIRAPVERAIANIKTWRILHTDYRRPLRTFLDTFHAVIGLYWRPAPTPARRMPSAEHPARPNPAGEAAPSQRCHQALTATLTATKSAHQRTSCPIYPVHP